MNTGENASIESTPPDQDKNLDNNTNRRGKRKGERVSQEKESNRYPLRSLRPMSNGKGSETLNESTAISIDRKRKRGRTAKNPEDEYSAIKRRVRYLLTRMNYEQNFIDAYSTEGWKGQSLEKLRPEKELERAKAEIQRCKMRIRDTFKHLESILSEGKLHDSLFDSKGEIDCEDIFCAKCGSKNVTPNNDIVLCDGICDRGFHQNCLNPPLLTEDIPPGDEGWLCPACDCKLDCIELLNESRESNLSFKDSWEKIFPEAATTANGTNQYDPSDLPSDDSGDDDYNPNISDDENNKNNIPDNDNDNDNGNDDDDNDDDEDDGEEGSSSDDSDFYTNSSEEDSAPKRKSNEKSNEKQGFDIATLPSDDSEDDDYDPEAGPEPGRESLKGQSSSSSDQSDESDFTSDSDEFCTEIAKRNEEVSGVSDHNQSMKSETGEEGVLPVVDWRRKREPLDYKKLYDETFGKESNGSSEDEDWLDKSNRKKIEQDDYSEDDSANSPRSQKNKRKSNKSNGGQRWKKNFGLDTTKALREYFEANQHPSNESKEILAQELGLTFQQVSKWFENARHFARVSSAGFPPIPKAEKSDSKFKRKSKKTSERMADTALSVTPIAAFKYDELSECGTSKVISPNKLGDGERKKAILQELRKRKMGK